MKLPITGARVYVMVKDVVEFAGIETCVEPGHIQIMMEENIAVVHDEDWKGFLSEAWGGPDQDDALWIFPFVDEETEEVFILAWRSPNQLGEYALLKPATVGCYEWAGDMPVMNKDALVKAPNWRYLNLINDKRLIGADKEYSPDTMIDLCEAYAENTGVLGAYCNILMVLTSIGRLPEELPAPLELVIDSTVKTGASLKRVQDWINRTKERLIASGVEIPTAVAHRLTAEASLPLTEDHWTDGIRAMVNREISKLMEEVEGIVANCTPPIEVVGLASNGAEYGSMIRRMYNEVITQGEEPDFDLAEQITQAMLDELDEQEQFEAMAWILVSAVMEGKSDASAWQRNTTSKVTMNMLRSLGLIGSIDERGEWSVPATTGIIVPAIPVTLNGVWFNMINSHGEYSSMSDVPKEIRAELKKIIERIEWSGVKIEVKDIEGTDRKAAVCNGTLIGYISKSCSLRNGQYTMIKSKAVDGNVVGMALAG